MNNINITNCINININTINYYYTLWPGLNYNM